MPKKPEFQIFLNQKSLSLIVLNTRETIVEFWTSISSRSLGLYKIINNKIFPFSLGIPCHSPEVNLLNVSPNASSDFRISRSSQSIIQSEVKLNCELSHKTVFLWHVYELIDEEDILLLSRNNTSELRITPRLLPVGNFLVQLTIHMLGTPVFGISQGYFQVVKSPLVAFIAGGSKVARGLDRTLIFDASMSYDPDEKDQQFLGWLIYRFSQA